MEKTVWQFLKILKQLCDPTILFLGIYPREMKIYIHTKIHTQLFITVLLKKKKKNGPKVKTTQMPGNWEIDKCGTSIQWNIT